MIRKIIEIRLNLLETERCPIKNSKTPKQTVFIIVEKNQCFFILIGFIEYKPNNVMKHITIKNIFTEKKKLIKSAANAGNTLITNNFFFFIFLSKKSFKEKTCDKQREDINTEKRIEYRFNLIDIIAINGMPRILIQSLTL